MAATLVIVAAGMPWAMIQNDVIAEAVSGIDAGRMHGGLTIGVGLVALLAFGIDRLPFYNLAIVAGLVGVARSLKDMFDIGQEMDLARWLGAEIRIGFGLWITLVGCVLCAVMAAKARNVLAEGRESLVPLRDAVPDLRVWTSRGG